MGGEVTAMNFLLESPLLGSPPAGTEIAHDTEPLPAVGAQEAEDSFSLLDYRTRRRALTPRLAPRGHYLSLSDGEQAWLLALEDKVTHIGRGLACEVRIEDKHVSRRHAIVVRHGHFARLLDDRSANGTYLNGRGIVATNIVDGDLLVVGPVAMRYIVLT